MSRLTLFLSFLSFTLFSNAQDMVEISGKLKAANEPLPYATVMLHSAKDSSFIKASFSDTTGRFVLKTDYTQALYIKVKNIGYQEYSSARFVTNGSNKNLGEIVLEPIMETLNAFAVTALRPMIEVEPDKTVFNVQGTLNATGANGLELLRKAPGVIVDNDNNIIVEGKTGVQVFINGKLSILSGDDLANYLKSMQSSDIDAIEIITQPSSRYDAAGNGGIINIRLKKDKNLGTNGSANIGNTYGRHYRNNNSISLNHRNKKANVFGTYSNNFGKNSYFLDFKRTQEGVLYQSETDNVNDINSHNGTVGADWFLNSKNTIGVLVSGNWFNTGSIGESFTNIIPLNTGDISQVLRNENVNVGQNYQTSVNLNYKYTDTLGRELSYDVDYGIYDRQANTYQPNSYYDANGQASFENNYRMITPTTINFFATKVDYVTKIWKGKLGFGAKYSNVQTDNTFNFYNVNGSTDTLNNDRSNQFEYTESIAASYANFGRKINQKLNLQLGVRMELTNSLGELTSTQVNNNDRVKREYLNWFPSGGLTYSQNRNNSWSLNYSRRIQRPNYQSLNPFESQISELSYAKGNPFLQPQYTSTFKLGHMFKYRFNTSLSYSKTKDFFAQITDTLDKQRSFMTPRNVANLQVINLGFSAPLTIKKWWNLFLNVNANNSTYTGTDEKFKEVSLNILNLYAQNTFMLGKKYKFEISGWFSTPNVWGGTYLTKSMGALNTALERKFLDNNLIARIAFNDMLFTSPWRADLNYGTLLIYGTGGGESRQVTVNLNYNFGNRQVKAQRKRETGLEDEKNRME
jgi:iron complex outermembrane receptor protein